MELAIKSTEYKAKDDTKVEGKCNVGFLKFFLHSSEYGFELIFAWLRTFLHDKHSFA